MFKFFAKGINFFAGKSLQKKNIFLSSSLEYLKRTRVINKNYFDYVRLATLELVSVEINNKKLKGNVAELGVYKGKFARYINFYFKERKLYLFDTFEGFDERDVENEKNKGFSSGSQDFSDTSIDSVLNLMPYSKNCIPIKGFFPESAKNIQEEFVFVSIDADLYEPIYKGLSFFYKLLVPGGYIFIHDFNNDSYPGARKAVEQFCDENNIAFLPLPDSAGSAIICK
ncbi:MAG: TylF/MycF/NovP-related O-methyltransferase [Ginsengibacter sp.]